MPDGFTVSLRTDNVLTPETKNAILALRVDYFNSGGEAITSVLRSSSFLDKSISRALPWGKGGALADIIADRSLLLDGDSTIDLSLYAPKDWNRKAILSFWMEGTGNESMAEFRLRNTENRK